MLGDADQRPKSNAAGKSDKEIDRFLGDGVARFFV
jgi:hypothetical protein